MSYHIVVPGPPVPQERARRGKGGRWYTPKASKLWRDKAAWAARQAGIRKPIPDPVALYVTIYWPDRRRRDVDNVAKAAMDALSRGRVALNDDSQVAHLVVSAFVDRERPRTEIEIRPLPSST